MNGASLLAWGDREARRRRQAAGAWARVPLLVWALAAGSGLGFWIARSAGALGGQLDLASLHGAARLWLAAVIAATALAIFGAPFRMYWRRDSALLARLPIRGSALFYVALWRSVRVASIALCAPAIACAGFALAGHAEIAVRHLALVCMAWSGAALLGPAAALLAGAVVASDRVEALLESVGGELAAPKTGWLGILPGLAATLVVLALIAAADWALGDPRTALGAPIVVLVPPAALALVAISWALRAADRVMLDAVREVSALDQVRLAHIERTRLSPLESLTSRLLGARARLVFSKDARLARRRYPLPYFLSSVGVLALWILAGVRPGDVVTWAVVIVAFNLIYAGVMARRRTVEPIEHRRFIRTLAIGDGDYRAGKWVQTALWTLVFVVVGVAPLVIVTLTS